MFRIAETLGGRTVGELEEALSVSEFAEWAAWFELKADAEKRAIERAKAEAKQTSRAGRRRR